MKKEAIDLTTDNGVLTFDRHEAARRLGIGIATLDRHLYKGTMPHVRIGRRVKFTSENLHEYLTRQTQNSTQNQN